MRLQTYGKVSAAGQTHLRKAVGRFIVRVGRAAQGAKLGHVVQSCGKSAVNQQNSLNIGAGNGPGLLSENPLDAQRILGLMHTTAITPKQ